MLWGGLIMLSGFIPPRCRMLVLLLGPEHCLAPIYMASPKNGAHGSKPKVNIWNWAQGDEIQLPTGTACLPFGGGSKRHPEHPPPPPAVPSQGLPDSAAAHGERVKYHFKEEAKAHACEYITRRTIYAQARVQFDTGIMKKRRSLWMT